jgi:hypothetical protein
MSLSVLQHVSHEDITGSDFTSISTTFTTQNVTAGSTIHVGGAASAPTGVADNSGSNTYDTPSAGANTYVAIAGVAFAYVSHAYNVVGGGKWAVTTSFASQAFVSVRIAELGGFSGTGETRDQTGSASSGSSNVASLVVTTSGNLTQNNELVLSHQNESNVCTTPPSGFTLLEGEGSFESMVDALLSGGSGATTSATWVASDGNCQIVALIATYMPTSAGPASFQCPGVIFFPMFGQR